MSAVSSLGRVVPSIGSLFPKYQVPTVQTATGNSITNFFSNLFKSAPKVAIPTASKVGTGTIKSAASGISKNIALGGGFALGSTAILSLTEGGQNLVSTTGQIAGNAADFGKSVNDLFNKNPFIPIGLLILGGLVVVSVIKK